MFRINDLENQQLVYSRVCSRNVAYFLNNTRHTVREIALLNKYFFIFKISPHDKPQVCSQDRNAIISKPQISFETHPFIQSFIANKYMT